MRYYELAKTPVRFKIDGAWHEGEFFYGSEDSNINIVRDRFTGLIYELHDFNTDDLMEIDTPHMETE